MRGPRWLRPGRQIRRRRRQSLLAMPSIGVIVLVVLGFLLAGAGGTGAYFFPVVQAAVSDTGHKPSTPTPRPSVSGKPIATPSATPPPAQAAVPGQPFTILLLGSDNDQKFTNADGTQSLLTQSMILVRVDPGMKQVTMLSIPRDLYVPLSTGGDDKIMSAFSYGGAQGAIDTVEEDFNVTVNEYVWIGLQGLVNLINYVGGVDVVTTNPVLDDLYPNDVGTSNAYGYKRLAVLPGPQHMNGMQALEYVRSRHSDAREDFGRSFRQQQVLVALREKLKGLNASDLPGMAQALNGEIQTSMSLTQIATLLPLASEVSTNSIRQIVMANGYTSDSTISANGVDEQILVPDWSAILPLVHQYFPATQ
ncbi:MAG: LCP family protein [Candidatus Dormiibacterota bacterium]